MQPSQENDEEKVNDVEYGEYQMFEEKKISTLSLSAKMKQPHEAVIALRNSGIFQMISRSIASKMTGEDEPSIEFAKNQD